VYVCEENPMAAVTEVQRPELALEDVLGERLPGKADAGPEAGYALERGVESSPVGRQVLPGASSLPCG
jgi:hypothetical protein